MRMLQDKVFGVMDVCGDFRVFRTLEEAKKSIYYAGDTLGIYEISSKHERVAGGELSPEISKRQATVSKKG